MDHKWANIRCGVRVVELRDDLTHACMWESERCVIQWIMGNHCHAWIQYGFTEMTEPRGITLKSAADISRLLFYCTCSRSFSFSVCSALFISFFPISLPHLYLPSTVHCQHVDLTNGHLSSLLEQLSLMRTLAADRASVQREPLISLWKMDAVFFFHLHWEQWQGGDICLNTFFYFKMSYEVTASTTPLHHQIIHFYFPCLHYQTEASPHV